jgi:hypothetical protein
MSSTAQGAIRGRKTGTARSLRLVAKYNSQLVNQIEGSLPGDFQQSAWPKAKHQDCTGRHS